MTEEKVKSFMRIASDTDRKIKAAMPLVNWRSQNEFVEKPIFLSTPVEGETLH